MSSHGVLDGHRTWSFVILVGGLQDRFPRLGSGFIQLFLGFALGFCLDVAAKLFTLCFGPFWCLWEFFHTFIHFLPALCFAMLYRHFLHSDNVSHLKQQQ